MVHSPPEKLDLASVGTAAGKWQQFRQMIPEGVTEGVTETGGESSAIDFKNLSELLALLLTNSLLNDIRSNSSDSSARSWRGKPLQVNMLNNFRAEQPEILFVMSEFPTSIFP